MPEQTMRDQLEAAFREFRAWLDKEHWFGRENEVVNQFAHRFLVPACASGNGPLTSPTQLGIEVAVQQVDDLPPDSTHKNNVRKDLVIWRDGDEVVFGDDYVVRVAPLAIIEWKARTKEISQRDVRWLSSFTSENTSTLGVAVSVDFDPVTLRAVFVTEGHPSSWEATSDQ